MKKILFSLAVLAGISATAQVKVGDNPTTINASALLEMESTSKGLLMSRMTTAQRTAIATPANGLQVFDTDTKGFWYYDGTKWIEGSTNVGGSKWTNDATNGLVKLTNLSDGITERVGDSIFTISDKGFVGIGTNQPSTKLHITSNNNNLVGDYSYTKGDNFITGTGTNFTEYFKVGDYLYFGGPLNKMLITAVTDTQITFDSVPVNQDNLTPRQALFLLKAPSLVVDKENVLAKQYNALDGSYFSVKYDNTNWSAPALEGIKFTGTEANPEPVKSNHVLLGLYGAGGTSTTRQTSVNVGAIRIVAAADFDTDYSQPNSATNPYSHPTYIDFSVTNHKATGRSEAMRIQPGGNVGIGTNAPTSTLHVNRTAPTGTISSVGTAVTGVGTNFTSAFRINDRITAGGFTRVVTDIISATELTVDTPWATDLAAGSVYRSPYRLNVGGGDALINGVTFGRGGGNDTFSVAAGYLALHSGTTAVYNVAIGNNSMNKTTTGNRSVAVGDNSLAANTTGYENVAIGARALANNTEGYKNTAVGRSALTSVTTGNNNTVLGHSAGTGITTGSNNTIIGSNISSLSAGLNNNIIIADGSGNRKIQVDSLGLVALNTNSFTSALNLKRGATGSGIVSHIMMQNPSATDGDGASIDFWGSSIAIEADKPSARISMIRAASGAHGAIVFSTRGSANSIIDTYERMRITNTGRVGIGTTNPSQTLTLQTALNQASDLGLYTKNDTDQNIGWVWSTRPNTSNNANLLLYRDNGTGLTNNGRIAIQPNGNMIIGNPVHDSTSSSKLRVDGYIQVGSSDTTGDTTPAKGMIRFNSTTNKFQGFVDVANDTTDGTADGWVDLH